MSLYQTPRRQSKANNSLSSSVHVILPFNILINPSIIYEHSTTTHTNTPSSTGGASSVHTKFKSTPSLSSSPSGQSLNSDNSSLDSSSNYTVNPSRKMTIGGGQSDKHIEMQLQWLHIMKEEFLKFIEKEAKLSSEMELKMLFLEHFYDPINEKVPVKLFKKREDLLQRLDLFSAKVLKWLMVEEWIEIEKLNDQSIVFYLRQFAKKLETNKLFQHEYLRDFIMEQAKSEIKSEESSGNKNVTSEEDISVEINVSDKPVPPIDNETEPEVDKDPYKFTLEQVKLICSMFSIELGDWFNFFEFKKRKKFKKWFESGLKDQCIPKYVLEIYKRKKDSVEKASKEFYFKNEDLNQKYIIESDWYYTNWISKQHTDDWYVTYSDMPNVVQYNSDLDRSVEHLGLRNTKIIGYLDFPVSQVVKSNSNDEHLRYLFGDVNWYSFTPINMAHSIHKYPHALMITTFKFGPMFALREIQNVFSAKSVFLGNRMTESSILFKSSDYLNNNETKDLIKVPFIGGRLFNMVDKNRTRYIEVRTLNVGGLLGKKILYSNPLTSKKLCLQNYHGVLKAVKDNELKGHKLPSPEENYLSRLFDNYCKEYCKIDLDKDEIL